MTTTKVRERPILFSGPMVRAILCRSKTQTRRIVKPQPPSSAPDKIGTHGLEEGGCGFYDDDGVTYRCPYGEPGSRLWVREAFLLRERGTRPVYKANMDPVEAAGFGAMYGGWKPSIFMPRKWSRITLEITDVRVQRLKDITANDVAAEGFPFSSDLDQFKVTWNALNAKRGFGWDVNPWVWAISFKRVEA